MELRIYRTFTWEPAPIIGEPVYGGPPRRQVLVAKDTLQVRAGGQWADVPVVEAERPPEPDHRRFFGRLSP